MAPLILFSGLKVTGCAVYLPRSIGSQFYSATLASFPITQPRYLALILSKIASINLRHFGTLSCHLIHWQRVRLHSSQKRVLEADEKRCEIREKSGLLAAVRDVHWTEEAGLSENWYQEFLGVKLAGT